MSRYLQNLVMRNLEGARGLSPRPATRYESVRKNGPVEITESSQAWSFQDLSSWTAPMETDISHVESTIERGRQTDASLPSESERELIRQRRQDQSGIFGEQSDEGETTENMQPDPTHEVSGERAAKLVSSVLRPNTAVPDRRGGSATPITQRLESLLGMSNRAVHPDNGKSSPSLRLQDVLNDSLRPTLNEVSFQPVRGDMIAPSTETRAPVVQIRIGRIEVRAAEPPVPIPNKKPVESPRSSVSLDQYLRRRSQEA